MSSSSPSPSADDAYRSRDVQHFEEWSRAYERSWLQDLVFGRVQAAVLDLAATLPPPASVLDVGCGTGRLLRAAALRWPEARLAGVDPAEGMVEVARRLTPGATVQRGLAEALPLPDASVDLVLSTMSFHHWHDQGSGVREIARVVLPGGHFILADFTMPRVLGWMTRHGGGLPKPERARLFVAAGLRIERQRRVAYPQILATVATLPK
jgi:ubiquinone/menaquinone biosynthesis C-methylase UbiE